MSFMVQYKDAYGALHNVEMLAENIDEAWKIAESFMLVTDRVQQIWQWQVK